MRLRLIEGTLYIRKEGDLNNRPDDFCLYLFDRQTKYTCTTSSDNLNNGLIRIFESSGLVFKHIVCSRVLFCAIFEMGSDFDDFFSI